MIIFSLVLTQVCNYSMNFLNFRKSTQSLFFSFFNFCKINSLIDHRKKITISANFGKKKKSLNYFRENQFLQTTMEIIANFIRDYKKECKFCQMIVQIKISNFVKELQNCKFHQKTAQKITKLWSNNHTVKSRRIL